MGLERLERRDAAIAEAQRAAELEAELDAAFAGAPPAEDLRRLMGRLCAEAEGAPIVTWGEIAGLVGRAWMMGARVALNTVQARSPCRICGCWQDEACDGGCAWAAPGLCTRCAGEG